MKYIGNKNRLLNFIDSVIQKEKVPKKGTFIDIFTGTTNVAQFYKKKGYKIISNDFMTYSYAFQKTYIENNSYPDFNKLLKELGIKPVKKLLATKDGSLEAVIDYLNGLDGSEGYFFENYAPGGKHGRRFFSDENAKRVDSIRDTIDVWHKKKLLQDSEYYILLSSLIDATDFVANMSGTYGAYLKIWRSMALKKLTLKVPNLIESKLNHKVYQEDSNLLIRKIKGDILYIDPPYNSRQYAPNFHVLESLAVWDKASLRGKTGLRPYDHQKSRYSQKNNCEEALADLIENSDVNYILMSYNNEGIIPEDFIKKVLRSRGAVKVYKYDYKRFRTERDHEKRKYKVPDDKVTEYIYFVKVK
ncbi:MAG: DNA adenine methylase [Candidatus Buchananbacteria bacterium]|nr:DNA adenine methylase [Candidatus Buchananbacteria bacterium]